MNSAPVKTSWLSVFVLIGAGAAVALQVGKVPATLPVLQKELGLTLVESGWVVAIFSLVAAGFAAFLGAIADRYGQLFVAIFGMLLTATAGIAGGFSPNGFVLLTTRIFEGLGFILTAVSIPPLIALAVSARHRRASLALWGSYLPVGSGLMLVMSGPLLYFFDWRILWWITALMILLFSIPVYRIGSKISREISNETTRPKLTEILKVASRPGPLLLAMIFAFYAAQYLIVAGFLPLILIELDGYSPVVAALVSAIVILLNAVGSAVSGWLHSRGHNPITLILVGCLVMAVGGGITFLQDISGLARIVAAGMFAGFGGLIPSSLFAEIPQHAPRQSFMASISGMLVQGAAIGQLAGPPIAAAFVAWQGNWQAAIPVMLIAAAITGCGTVMLSKIDKRVSMGNRVNFD